MSHPTSFVKQSSRSHAKGASPHTPAASDAALRHSATPALLQNVTHAFRRTLGTAAALGVLVVGSCTPSPAASPVDEGAPPPVAASQPPETPPASAPTHPVGPDAALPTTGSGAAVGGEPHSFRARAEAVDGTRNGQEQLADLLLDAVRRSDTGDVETALRTLGRRLSEYRADRYEASLVGAIQWFSAAENRGLRGRVDGRFAVPAFEVLLDVRDAAAVGRLGDSYRHGPAAAAVEGAISLSRSFATAAGRLHARGATCVLSLDGQPLAATDSPSVTIGSHTLACADQPPRLFVAEALDYDVVVQDGQPLPHARLP